MASRAANIFIYLSLFQVSFVSSRIHVSKISQKILGSSSQYPLCESGYYDIPDLKDSRMFYYFFEERSVQMSPIMLWLTGVPGLSSSISLFHENGPYHINSDLNLTSTMYGWDKLAKIIYVDEPIGTGFSFIKNITHYRFNMRQVVHDLYNFLQEFISTHPNYKDNDFFITGQSYAGKYAPMLADKIYEGNKDQSNIYIHLKGVAIGNGLTNPGKQLSTIPYFCESNGLVEEKYWPIIFKANEKCQSSISKCDNNGNFYSCSKAYTNCGELLRDVIYYSGGKNIYDHTKQRVGYLNYNFSNVESYLNLESVKTALSVEIRQFHLLSEDVSNALSGDYMLNSERYVANLLNLDINVLIYVGNLDILSNVDGNLLWVTDLKWNGTREFRVAKEYTFFLDNNAAAGLTEYGALRYLEVYNAGHMAAMDQPKVVFTMINDWMKHASRTIR